MDGRLTVTESELLEAVREALEKRGDGDDKAFTIRELTEALGLPDTQDHRKTRDAVRRMIQSGTAEVCKVRRPALDGRNALVPAYRMKAA